MRNKLEGTKPLVTNPQFSDISKRPCSFSTVTKLYVTGSYTRALFSPPTLKGFSKPFL